jgi:hypothetical protein
VISQKQKGLSQQWTEFSQKMNRDERKHVSGLTKKLT